MLIYQVLFSPLGSFFFLNFPWRMILGRNAALRHHARRCFELRAGPLRGRVRASRVSISLEGGEAGCMTADLWTANKNVKLWWNHVKLVTLWVAFSYAFFFWNIRSQVLPPLWATGTGRHHRWFRLHGAQWTFSGFLRLAWQVPKGDGSEDDFMMPNLPNSSQVTQKAMNHFYGYQFVYYLEIFFNFLGFVAVLLSKSGDCYHADSCSSSCSGFCISTRVDRWRQISSIRRSTSMQYRQSSGRRGLHPAQVWHVVCDMWNELKWQKTQWNNEEIGNSILSSTIACGIVRHTLCTNDFPQTSHLVIKPNRRHRVVVIDDFFSHEALQELRDFLLESTIWTDVKRGAPAEQILKIAA